MKNPSWFLPILFLALVFSCNKEEDNPTNSTSGPTPEVETTEKILVGSVSAIFSGKIIRDHGSLVSERGFCWDTMPAPTIASSKLSLGKGAGSFEGTVEGLQGNTEYYLRTYGTSSNGTGYGNTFVLQLKQHLCFL